MLRDRILQLKEKCPLWGYKKIAKELGCSANAVKYHIHPLEKGKSYARCKKYKSQLLQILKRKVDSFHCTAGYRYRQLNGRNGPRNRAKSTFSPSELLSVIQQNPVCYLTNIPINLLEPRTWQLDHKIPISKGGDNSFKNCGLCSRSANMAKSDMTPEEFLIMCRKVVSHLG